MSKASSLMMRITMVFFCAIIIAVEAQFVTLTEKTNEAGLLGMLLGTHGQAYSSNGQHIVLCNSYYNGNAEGRCTDFSESSVDEWH
jgi:hypothetical protein